MARNWYRRFANSRIINVSEYEILWPHSSTLYFFINFFQVVIQLPIMVFSICYLFYYVSELISCHFTAWIIKIGIFYCLSHLFLCKLNQYFTICSFNRNKLQENWIIKFLFWKEIIWIFTILNFQGMSFAKFFFCNFFLVIGLTWILAVHRHVNFNIRGFNLICRHNHI